MIRKLKIFLKNYPSEGYIWIASLLLLSFAGSENSHFTICPLNNIGVEFCPGCGLGRSIHYLINLNLKESLSAHPLGVASFFILLYRILFLTKNSFHKVKTNLSY